MSEKLPHRRAMYWLKGYSMELSGEELKGEVDELYRDDFERGRAVARELLDSD